MKGYPLGILVHHLDSIPDVLISNETGIITQKELFHQCNFDKKKLSVLAINFTSKKKCKLQWYKTSKLK
jgi:hypothetical protein